MQQFLIQLHGFRFAVAEALVWDASCNLESAILGLLGWTSRGHGL